MWRLGEGLQKLSTCQTYGQNERGKCNLEAMNYKGEASKSTPPVAGGPGKGQGTG